MENLLGRYHHLLICHVLQCKMFSDLTAEKLLKIHLEVVISIAFSDRDKWLIIRILKKYPKARASQIAVELLRRGISIFLNSVRNVCKAAGYHGS